MTRHLILILGDQLNFDNPALDGFDASQDAILMVEAVHEATHVWSHKARVALFLSAMRHFYAALLAQYPRGIKGRYLKLGEHPFTTLKAAWTHEIAALTPQKVIICEPGEYRIEQDLIHLCEDMNTQLCILDDTHFMCSKADFSRWAGESKGGQARELRMEFFYRKMRQKYEVLMQGTKPVGGAWNYDTENRKSFGRAGPKNPPEPPKVNIDHLTQSVIDEVNKFFPHHPGSLEHFIWPVTRAEALRFLVTFIESKLSGFGEHQDAMWQSSGGGQSPYLVEPEQLSSSSF
ncbi:MAG: hypothetical protein CVU29_12020 [Betaproteobacteria bacterium HGW-Betaproteobacteria-22]|nr:MAG: hypothetical protein CVU29_12020 [Betaproteobacteria bacterium HGW-Betaproteobacteria-22]